MSPRRAVDAGQHLALFVAAPIGARRSLKGDAHRVGIDLFGILDVRPPAQILEFILAVGADDDGFLRLFAVFVQTTFFQPFDQFDLIGLALEYLLGFARR